MVYAWAADGTVIAGQTTDKLVVTADMIGKKISVTVTGDEKSTATAETSAVTAADTEDLAIVSAKQTNAKHVDVTFNKAPGNVTISVTRSGSAISQEIIAKSDSVATLEFGSNLIAGTYVVTATGEDGKKCEGEFTAEAAELTTVEFVNNSLIVSGNTTEKMKKAYAAINSVDQWGNHMNLTGATFTVSKESKHSFNADTGILTIEAPVKDGTGTTNYNTYNVGETVVVTVQYGNPAKVVSGVLTVALADTVETLTFGELATDSDVYKDGLSTQKALLSGSYYFPVTEAVSSNGIKLDADMLNDMLQRTGNEGGTLFISPNVDSAAGAMVYASKFSTKKINNVNTPVLEIAAGEGIKKLNVRMDYQISVVSQSGASQQLSVPIELNPVVDTVTITYGEFYAGKKSEVTITAVDQYGDAYDIYDKISQDGTNNNTLKIHDTYEASAYTQITFTPSTSANVLSFTQDNATKKVHVYITPTAKGFLNIIGTTAGFKSVSYPNITINDRRDTTGIQGLDASISLSMSSTADTQTVSTSKIIFTGSDSEKVGSADSNYPIYVGPATTAAGITEISKSAAWNVAGVGVPANATQPTQGTDRYYWTWYNTNANANIAVGTSGTGAGDGFTVGPTASPKTGDSATVRILLYRAVLESDGSYSISKVTYKDYDFKIIAEEDLTYQLAVEKNATTKQENNLFTGKIDSDILGITLTTTEGAKVDQALLENAAISWTNNNKDGVTFYYDTTNHGIRCANKGGANTVSTATITATFSSAGKTVTVSKDFGYTKDTPVCQSIGLFYDLAGKAAYDGQAVYMDANALVPFTANGTVIYILAPDQYGNDIVTDWVDDTVDPISVKVLNKSGTNSTNVGGANYIGNAVKVYGTGAVTANETKFDVVLSANGKSLTMNVTAAGSNTLPTAAVAADPITTVVSNGDWTQQYKGGAGTAEVLSCYTKSGAKIAEADTTITIKDKDGNTVSDSTASAEKFFEVAEGTDTITPKFNAVTNKNIVGDYSVEVKVGSVTVKKTFKITAKTLAATDLGVWSDDVLGTPFADGDAESGKELYLGWNTNLATSGTSTLVASWVGSKVTNTDLAGLAGTADNNKITLPTGTFTANDVFEYEVVSTGNIVGTAFIHITDAGTDTATVSLPVTLESAFSGQTWTETSTAVATLEVTVNNKGTKATAARYLVEGLDYTISYAINAETTDATSTGYVLNGGTGAISAGTPNATAGQKINVNITYTGVSGTACSGTETDNMPEITLS